MGAIAKLKDVELFTAELTGALKGLVSKPSNAGGVKVVGKEGNVVPGWQGLAVDPHSYGSVADLHFVGKVG